MKSGMLFAYEKVNATSSLSGKEELNLRKIILASHGSLAEGMHSAAKMILGSCDNVTSYGLDTYGNPIDIYNIVEHIIKASLDDEFIILCDINGGSVHNQLLHLCMYPNVHMVTGMTLSIVLECALANEEQGIEELLNKTVDNARKNILIFDYNRVKEELNEGIEDDKLW